MILEIITIMIIFIVILTFIFLLIGLKINVNLNKKGPDLKGIIEVKWAFINIFSKNFPVKDKNRESKDQSEKLNRSDKSKSNLKENDERTGIDNKEEDNKKNSFNEFKTLIPLIKENLDDIFDFILVCINSVNLEIFNSKISLGLPSPYDTANIVGYIWAFSSIPNLSKNFYLSAEPVFTKEIVDFDIEMIFKINLLGPFGSLFKLLTKKNIIELIWKSRKLFNND